MWRPAGISREVGWSNCKFFLLMTAFSKYGLSIFECRLQWREKFKKMFQKRQFRVLYFNKSNKIEDENFGVFFYVKRRMFTVLSRLYIVNMFEQPKKSTVRANLRLFVKSSIQSTELKNIVLWKRTWDFDRKNLRVRFCVKGVRRLERNSIKFFFLEISYQTSNAFCKNKIQSFKNILWMKSSRLVFNWRNPASDFVETGIPIFVKVSNNWFLSKCTFFKCPSNFWYREPKQQYRQPVKC